MQIHQNFLSKQLTNPSGLLGKFVLGRLWNRRNAILNDVAFDSLALDPDDHVLEVGFGGGYLLGRMAAVVTEGFLAGVDGSPAMVDFCRQRFQPLLTAGRLELKCARAESIPYPSGYFTKACSVNSIFYWENASQAISELYRVLRVNGTLVMCFTCKACLQDKRFARHGVTLYEAEEIHHMLEWAGFRDIRTTRASDKHRQFLCTTSEK